MRKSRVQSWGIPVHPGPGARRKPKRFGYSPLIRCQQCGFPNDARNTAWSEKGEGNTVVAASGVASSDIVSEMAVRAGCAQCGSMNWHKGRPPKIEDDRKKPWKKRL